MSVSTIEGFVENGQIKLPPSVKLPEHAKVYVVVPDAPAPRTSQMIISPRLAHPVQAIDFQKKVIQDRD